MLKKRIAHKVAQLIIMIGVLSLLGTVGASDINQISFAQTLKQCVNSIIIILFGYLFV